MSAPLTGRAGVTLMELLVASGIALVVLLAIGQVDVTRVHLTQGLGPGAVPQSEAAFAIAHMTRALEQADRLQLVSPSLLQLRIPQNPNNLDAAAGYRWAQYSFGGGQIHYYDPACTLSTAFRDLSALAISYRNEAIAPPGGEPPVAPAGADNNILLLTVSWVDPRSGATEQYASQVTIRAGAYTGIMTGLAPAGISNPPATCPP